MTDKNEEKNKDLEKQLEEQKKKAEEYLENWKKERASFLNYKKEEAERMGELVKYANAGTILKLLPVLDNFDLAIKKIPAEMQKDKHVEGILQIASQIKEFLKSQGVEEIKTVGRKFDPACMEAVEEVSSEAINTQQLDRDRVSIQSGLVVEEARKGYTINGQVLRPARVKISK